MPEIDDMFTIAPRLFSRMIAAAALVPFQVPFRWTAITSSNCSSVILRIVASRVIPALFTMMSRPPKCSTAAADQRVDLVGLGHVASHRQGGVGPELLGGGLRRGEVEITEHHLGALGDEELGDRITQTLRTAGDDRCLICQQ